MQYIRIILIALFFVKDANCAVLNDLMKDDKKTNIPQKAVIYKTDKIQKVFENSKTNSNVLKFKYTEDSTYKVTLRTAMSTVISLPEDETITYFTLGDGKFFEAEHNEKLPNILKVKPLFSGLDTNLIIKTDIGSIYNFYLKSQDETSKLLPAFTVYVKKNGARKAKKILQQIKSSNNHVTSIRALSDLNTSYSIKGEKQIAPIFAYDDGKFTYFDFGKNFVSDRLPVAYKVIDERDTVANTRTDGNLIVAESLSVEGWILKNGDKHVCIKPKRSLYKVYKDERFK